MQEMHALLWLLVNVYLHLYQDSGLYAGKFPVLASGSSQCAGEFPALASGSKTKVINYCVHVGEPGYEAIR